MIRRRDFPKSVVVKDVSYGLKFVRNFPESAGAQPLDGYCCYESQTIYLRHGLKPTARLSTAIHEILHAIDEEWGTELTHAQVYKLEEALLRFLTDNDLIA